MKIFGYAVGHAIVAALYIIGIATLLPGLQGIVPEKTFIAPFVFITILVTSVAVMGALIFMRPAMWYMDGKKREAVELLVGTIAALALIAAAVILAFFAVHLG